MERAALASTELNEAFSAEEHRQRLAESIATQVVSHVGPSNRNGVGIHPSAASHPEKSGSSPPAKASLLWNPAPGSGPRASNVSVQELPPRSPLQTLSRSECLMTLLLGCEECCDGTQTKPNYPSPRHSCEIIAGYILQSGLPSSCRSEAHASPFVALRCPYILYF